MKVLISGATGYLGGRIANYLNRKGINVVKGSRKKLIFLIVFQTVIWLR